MEEGASLGYLYLLQRYSLKVCQLFSQSFATRSSTKRSEQNGWYVRTYYPVTRFRFEATWQSQLTFALKYEGVNLEVLKAFFAVVALDELVAFIQSAPFGTTQRKVWFLFEFLTGQTLALESLNTGKYLLLIDDTLQLALPKGKGVRSMRHRVTNNLIGNQHFAPYVRKGQGGQADGLPFEALQAMCTHVLEDYAPELIYRATQYLYLKETKTSFAIEYEASDQRRTDTFVSMLRSLSGNTITKQLLLEVQNGVVDARYRQSDWRTEQVYVGETVTPDFERVHFIAPRAQDVPELMEAFLSCLRQWSQTVEADPIALAAVMGFAFVFLHPFDDGNGRVHRFLIHSLLAQRGFPPNGLICPISAVMLKKRQQYDWILETFSSRLMPLLDYKIDAHGAVTVHNASIDFYRFIDYTPFVNYLSQVLEETIRTEWTCELEYLRRYDVWRRAMREVVDLPEKKANLFIRLVQQNKGTLSSRKRDLFEELSDEDIQRLEACLRED